MRYIRHSLIVTAPTIAFLIGLMIGSFAIAVIGLVGMMLFPAMLMRSEKATDDHAPIQMPLAAIQPRRAA